MRSLYADAVVACFDLIGRAGASEGQMAWTCPHVPDEGDNHHCAGVTWSATAKYRGTRLMVDGHKEPTAAAMALAVRLLTGAVCRCTRPVVLSDSADGCRWRLVGARWEPGCDAEPIHVGAKTGDYAAMNRAMRRRVEKRRGAA